MTGAFLPNACESVDRARNRRARFNMDILLKVHELYFDPLRQHFEVKSPREFGLCKPESEQQDEGLLLMS